MTSGRAYGQDRAYQEFCRDALRRLHPELSFHSGDGVDVPFAVGGTTWTFDVALTNPERKLIVAECRRRQDPLKQESVAAFAYKVELLRRELGVEVAGVFFTRRDAQIGAVRSSTHEGIELVICEQDQPLDAFSLVFHTYDPNRERRVQSGAVYVQYLHLDRETPLKLKAALDDALTRI